MNAKKLGMVVAVVILGIGMVAFALGGFGGGLTKKVIGIWHYTATPASSREGIARDCFLEIEETAIVHDGLDGQEKRPAVLKEKDGTVFVYHPNILNDKMAASLGIMPESRAMYRITVVDSDTLETEVFWLGKVTMKRSTAEARATGLENNKKAAAADETADKAYNETYAKKMANRFGVN